MALIFCTSAIPTPQHVLINPPPTFPQLKDGGKQPRRHTDESPPGEKTEKKLRLQRWNITEMDKWRRWRGWEDDGELGWWDELSDKLVMNASVGGRRKGVMSQNEKKNGWRDQGRQFDEATWNWWKVTERNPVSSGCNLWHCTSLYWL